jgi:hypothetical protein
MKYGLINVEVPQWTRYIAWDSFGVFMAFEHLPIRHQGTWRCFNGRKRDVLQYHRQSYRGWTKSLRPWMPRHLAPVSAEF